MPAALTGELVIVRLGRQHATAKFVQKKIDPVFQYLVQPPGDPIPIPRTIEVAFFQQDLGDARRMHRRIEAIRAYELVGMSRYFPIR